MKSYKDPRHISRILAAMELYCFFYPHKDLSFNIFEILDNDINYAKSLYDKITQGVKQNHAQIDDLINKFSNPIKTIDLDLLVLTILRISIFESFIAKITPEKVSIDEAIELTRDFGIEFEYKKVSGILGNLYNQLRNINLADYNDS